jgi:hypothetical protein
MNHLREAAQQALEALDLLDEYDITRAMLTDEAIEQVWATADAATDALRDALAQPEQEPVAWMVYTQDGKSVCVTDNPADFTDEHRALPLYTHPPRREWQSLTNEDISLIDWEKLRTRKDAVRAIEAALKEKNQ